MGQDMSGRRPSDGLHGVRDCLLNVSGLEREHTVVPMRMLRIREVSTGCPRG